MLQVRTRCTQGDTIVVFHFHQGSTPWRLQELLPLGSGGENSR
jgi:hypothetical protein